MVVRTGTQPGEMDQVSSKRVNKDDIEFTWEMPATNGFVILEYDVQIFDKTTYSFITEPAICDGKRQETIGNLECKVSSKTLTKDYGYRSGDLFVVRVRAKNRWGWGNWSVPNTKGATVFELLPLDN